MRPSRLYCRLSSAVSLFMLFSSALTFNVDTVTPTVHSGPHNSMFGFAIAQYKQGGRSWLIIGAPTAQTNQPNVTEGGAVYRCVPDHHNRCEQIPFDQQGSETVDEYGRTEMQGNKSCQWFGATVQTSEDGIIVACAPRYVHFGYGNNLSKREPIGVCWMTKGDFTTSKPYYPCKDHAFSGYYKQGFCQAGFSAALTKTGERLYIGAVGSWHWQGQVFSQNLLGDNVIHKTNSSPKEYDDTYLGYSAAVGEFTGDNDMDVVVGMPRDNITGKVVLFDSTLHNLLNITGEQIGSYFGYSLCVADINGDQLDDIVIGAPLYSGFEAKRGMYEEGRVYVIFQTNKHMFNGMIHIDGTRTKARFGLALCSVGDINRDGYQDFAVGAPYGGEHGNGAVYLYHGNSEGVDKEASQVIEPQDFGDSEISTFGFSLSGGMDLDNNYYPDLLVGAYASDRVIHFRSRPIVNVTAKLEFSTEYISLEERKCNLKGETPVSCFEVTLCLEYTGIGIEQELAFLYELKLDSMKEDSRVFFLTEEIREKNISIRLSKDSHYCTLSDYVFVQPKIRDKLTPITISLKYFLLDPRPASRRLKSIVSQDVPNEVSKRMNIQKNCGKDNECFPDLQLDVIPNMDKFVIEDKRRLELNVIISNAGEDAFEAMFYLDMPLDVNFIRINETKTEFSIACTGAQPETGMNELVCDIGNPLPVNASLQFKVLLEPSGIVSATDEFVFKVIVKYHCTHHFRVHHILKTLNF